MGTFWPHVALRIKFEITTVVSENTKQKSQCKGTTEKKEIGGNISASEFEFE